MMMSRNKDQKIQYKTREKKFKDITKAFDCELIASESYKDKDINEAFNKLEEAIQKVKTGDTPSKEYDKL